MSRPAATNLTMFTSVELQTATSSLCRASSCADVRRITAYQNTLCNAVNNECRGLFLVESLRLASVWKKR